jgi:hypothetical protein
MLILYMYILMHSEFRVHMIFSLDQIVLHRHWVNSLAKQEGSEFRHSHMTSHILCELSVEPMGINIFCALTGELTKWLHCTVCSSSLYAMVCIGSSAFCSPFPFSRGATESIQDGKEGKVPRSI